MKVIITVPFTGVKEFLNSNFGQQFSIFMRWYSVKIDYVESDDTIDINNI